MPPALIFDEFVERPFTENSRWRGSNLKIHALHQAATCLLPVKRKQFDCGAPDTRSLCKVSSQRLESSHGFFPDVGFSRTARWRKNPEIAAFPSGVRRWFSMPRSRIELKAF
jgi:hypothetical protein